MVMVLFLRGGKGGSPPTSQIEMTSPAKKRMRRRQNMLLIYTVIEKIMSSRKTFFLQLLPNDRSKILHY
jgi:hypothetical protein